MINFEGIERRGGHLVAAFQDGIGKFVLDRHNLLIRITNIEAGKGHPNKDASVERVALAELDDREDRK